MTFQGGGLMVPVKLRTAIAHASETLCVSYREIHVLCATSILRANNLLTGAQNDTRNHILEFIRPWERNAFCGRRERLIRYYGAITPNVAWGCLIHD